VTVSAGNFDINVSEDDEVSTLRKLTLDYFSKQGLPSPEELRFIYQGTLLEQSNRTFREIGFTDDTILVLVNLQELKTMPSVPEEQKSEEKMEIEAKDKMIAEEKDKVILDENESDENSDDEDEEEENGKESSESEDGEEQEIHIPQIIDLLSNIAIHIDWSDVPMPNPNDLNEMMAMGFPKWRCQKALLLHGFDLDLALEWIVNNLDDPSIDDPLTVDQLSLIMTIFPENSAVDSPPMSKLINQALEQNKCTFTVTGKTYVKQKWFFCYTCGYIDSEGVCESCANICHKGHSLSDARGTSTNRASSFYCDCGSGTACHCNK